MLGFNLERKCEASERNGGQRRREGRAISGGGGAKQVYVEKRRKHEEKWERKRGCGNTGESNISKKRPEP